MSKRHIRTFQSSYGNQNSQSKDRLQIPRKTQTFGSPKPPRYMASQIVSLVKPGLSTPNKRSSSKQIFARIPSASPSRKVPSNPESPQNEEAYNFLLQKNTKLLIQKQTLQKNFSEAKKMLFLKDEQLQKITTDNQKTKEYYKRLFRQVKEKLLEHNIELQIKQELNQQYPKGGQNFPDQNFELLKTKLLKVTQQRDALKEYTMGVDFEQLGGRLLKLSQLLKQFTSAHLLSTGESGLKNFLENIDIGLGQALDSLPVAASDIDRNQIETLKLTYANTEKELKQRIKELQQQIELIKTENFSVKNENKELVSQKEILLMQIQMADRQRSEQSMVDQRHFLQQKKLLNQKINQLLRELNWKQESVHSLSKIIQKQNQEIQLLKMKKIGQTQASKQQGSVNNTSKENIQKWLTESQTSKQAPQVVPDKQEKHSLEIQTGQSVHVYQMRSNQMVVMDLINQITHRDKIIDQKEKEIQNLRQLQQKEQKKQNSKIKSEYQELLEIKQKQFQTKLQNIQQRLNFQKTRSDQRRQEQNQVKNKTFDKSHQNFTNQFIKQKQKLLSQQIENYKKQIQDLKQQIQQKTEKLSLDYQGKTEQVQNLKKKINQLEKTIQNRQKELFQKQEDKQKLYTEIKKKQEEISLLSGQNSDLKSQIIDVMETCSKLQFIINTLQQEKTTLQISKNKTALNFSRLISVNILPEKSKYLQYLSQLEKQFASLRQQLSSKQKQYLTISSLQKHQIEKLYEKLQSAQQHSSSKEKQVESQKTFLIKNLEQAKTKHSQIIKELNGQISSLKQENQEECLRFEAKIQSLQKKISEILNQKKSLILSNQDSQNKIKTILKHHQQSKLALKLVFSQQTSRIHIEFQKKLNSISQKLSSYNSQATNIFSLLKKVKSNLNKKFQEQTSQKTQTTSSLQALLQINQKLQQDIQSLQKAYKKLQEQHNHTLQENSKLSKQQTSHTSLSQKIEDLLFENARLSQQKHKLQTQQDSVVFQMQKQIDELKSKQNIRQRLLQKTIQQKCNQITSLIQQKSQMQLQLSAHKIDLPSSTLKKDFIALKQQNKELRIKLNSFLQQELGPLHQSKLSAQKTADFLKFQLKQVNLSLAEQKTHYQRALDSLSKKLAQQTLEINSMKTLPDNPVLLYRSESEGVQYGFIKGDNGCVCLKLSQIQDFSIIEPEES